MLNLFAHSLAVYRQFGQLFFRSLEGRREERRGVESGFLLRLRREGFGAKEVFDWRHWLGEEGLGEELRGGRGFVGNEELAQISHEIELS